MLLFAGFLIFTIVGSGVSGYRHRPRRYSEPSCPKNEHYTRNNPQCIRTCANKWVPHSDDCKPFTGCVCNGRLVRLNDDGSGKCVPESKCRNTCKDPNAVYKDTLNPCPLTCDHPKPRPCPYAAINKAGCECAPDFVLDEANGKCVRPKECREPMLCPKNSHYVKEDNQCPKTCGNRLMPNSDVAGACVPFTGCSCKPGFVRRYDNATGPCIPKKKCPPIPTQCGVNEVATSCRIICPPQTCDSIFSSYNCLPTECEPGCDCKNGYLRNKDGICSPSDDCFKPNPMECGENEVASDCAIQCPPQSCESLFTTYMCAETNCTSGCNCIDGFLRNSLGLCVPSEECYNDPAGCNGDVNANRARGCVSPYPPTCKNPDPKLKADVCELNGCECKPGYIKSCRDGKCIEVKDCPGGSPRCGVNQTYVGCKFGCPTNYCPIDDSRAQVACSIAYPCQGGCACTAGYLIVSADNPQCVLASDCPEVTCTRPNEVFDRNPPECFLERCEDRGSECNYPYPPGPRCVCEDGYYRNESDICVPASECPPLGCKGDLNATFTECTSYCPPTCDDIGQEPKSCIALCGPGGCQCNPGYVLNKEGKCVNPEDCPDMGCKGDPNAVYKGCPSACEPTCTKPDRIQVCTRQCMPPGCVCKPDFVLNEKTGKCVKPETCSVADCKGDPNAVFSDCPSACEPNCTNPKPQICTKQCMPPGCVCKSGYVLNEKTGKCVKPKTCPVKGCGGDRNAVHKDCPSACEPSCANPDPRICTEQCLPPGCVCKKGYVKSKEGGKCIKPDTCPVGCNGDRNATYKDCRSHCPLTCDDKEPMACIASCAPSGCECNTGYVLDKDGKCIKPNDCPVVDEGCGGDLNATHADCPSACPPTCANRNNREDIICPSVCDPSGYLGCKGDPNAVYKDCPSACEPTCTKPKTGICTRQCMPPGCVCKPDYVLNEKTGKCVKVESCPVVGCGGDPNAVHKDCPSACEPSCANPDPKICTKQCLPPGCVCKPGYVKSKEGGKCIKPDTCPVVDEGCGGDLNATHADCPSACPPTCADRNNREDIICPAVCDPSGCVCKQGYILTKKGEKCVKPEDCPDLGCKGDPNAVYKDCPSACEPTCTKPKTGICTRQCMPPGCVCKPDYVLNEKTGKCVKVENCPVVGCGGDPNAVYTTCTSACEPTCTNPDPQICTLQCLPASCVCKEGYVKNEETGKCVKPETCPVIGCGGDPNAVYTTCTSACEPTCTNPAPEICTLQCLPASCVCKEGYVKNEETGKCVKPETCPVVGCGGDPNAVHKDCPSACEPSCLNPNPQVCTDQCMPPSCVCKPDFVLNEETGKCVKLENCPVIGCGGDPNAVYTTCTSACEPTCTNPAPEICTLQCLPASCVCKEGYVKNEETGKCVKPETCPVVGCGGDPNAVYTTCTSACEPTCTNPAPEICTLQCLPASCVCKEGYVKNEETGKCVKPETCPVIGCGGDPNAVYTTCTSACEPTCTNPDPQICTLQCLPASCVCKEGYVKNEETGKCVKPETCPVIGCGGDPNAVYTTCTSACEPTCTNPAPEICTLQCLPASCVCKEGYVKNEETGKCVKPETCPVIGCGGDPNAVYTTCTSACEPTCTNPAPEICTLQCLPASCVCKEGYVKNEETGKCVKPETCPAEPQCKGDRNATYTESPKPCKPTCKNPEPKGECMDMPMPPGCECKQGYILKKKGGRCIKPEDCKGGWPKCRANETYVYCDAGCPTDYCPVDDSLAIIACDPPYPCPGGCSCKAGYLMVSEDDNRCILSSECPQIKCSRPNEFWDAYAPGCFRERCDDRDIPCDFQYPGPPKCRCIPGYYRNQDGICVPESECSQPGCDGDLNATFSDCPSPCPATCGDSPDQGCATVCAEPGCVCNEGFVRSGPGGVCIRREDCGPSTPVCGKNEIARDCRRICPPQTCLSKYALFRCVADIPCEPGCDCIPNYLRNNKGICIPSEECPPLKPEPVCGYNEVSVPCRQICPPQNCDIAYTDYACTNESEICEPGCNCLPDHLRNGSGICIPNEKCTYPTTPVCGINEIARDCKQICPPQSCQSKYIEYNCLEDIPCESGCDCVPNYLRDDKGICIPSEKCPPLCPISDECQRTCASPNPPNCVYNPSEENLNGCNCKEGYILSEKGGDCIPIEECPSDIACHGDPNAVPKRCPKPCPSTCDSPDQTPCKRACDPIACVCKPGYLLSNETGQCILPDKCPGGNPCGKKGRFVDCKTDCPGDYCPVDDSRELVFCDPPAGHCLSGCICNINHRRKSRKDPRCIQSSKCCPVNCTRPNEEWSSCPSDCLAENCEDVDSQPTTCNTLLLNCQPKCICKKNHFRDSNGICIPAKDCPRGCDGDLNAVFSTCPSACEQTCHSSQNEECTEQCLDPGCVCKPGFVLNEDSGKCIAQEDCPVPKCEDENAVYNSCPSACEPTCANPGPHDVCTDNCKPAGCVCKEGFIFNEEDGKCVKPEHCPVC